VLNWIAGIMPNVAEHGPDLLQATADTLVMVLISGVISIVLGLALGIVLVVTSPGHIYASKNWYGILGKIINTVRSIPFVILLALILPFTRLLVGTSIGIPGAIVPMIVGITPFIARQTEQTLTEVDRGVIEAAQAMGVPKLAIIVRVMLREALPGIIRALVISLISLIGLSAMAGTVGGGGLGDFAIRYGYAQYMQDITVVTTIILLLIVNLVQGMGNWAVRKSSH
jgi:D-methionine transport system permease protein